jgi:DNA-directed RNA polymerase alpha subunit
MEPIISNISEENDSLSFRMSNCNVSLANAIRRTILSDIPTVVFYTENHKDNQCAIEINTTRLHNEIIKQRLSCIPVHIQELDILPGKFVMELDVMNDTDITQIITTEDFRIRNKENSNYLAKEDVKRIFPPNKKTNMYIDFARLRPKMCNTVPGEQLKLSAEFSVHTAKDSSMFNVVSKCTYFNTPDPIKINSVWDTIASELTANNTTKEDIALAKANFYLLDAQRHFLPDSFDFTIETVGVFENKAIVKKACIILQNTFVDFIKLIDSGSLDIHLSETTVENSYDVVLENEDYTIGKVIEYILYEKYYQGEKIMTYCGFKKFHPHDSGAVIRIAYKNQVEKDTIHQHIRIACIDASAIFEKIIKTSPLIN